MLKRWSLPLALLTVLALPVLAMASEGHPSIPGAELSAVWVIPFVCMLLSIAIMPLALPHIWHHHFGKISVFWGLAFLIPCLVVYGFNVAFYEFLHAILLEYIPFIVLLFALFTARYIGKKEAGTAKMKEIADAIATGARAFLFAEYRILIVFAVVLFLVIGLVINWLTAVCFVLGALFSTLAGFFGMTVATKANVRTANAARERGMNKALKIAFSGGAVMGLSVVGLGVIGVGLIFLFLNSKYDLVSNASALNILTGFSLGASSIALFARVGGGIYTKAADVGADLVGKVEAGIPEDDPRNPATIADNVGDNVGDVAGMGADLFESYVGSIISAITLAFAATTVSSRLYAAVFPLVLCGVGILGSVIATFFVRAKDGTDPQRALNRGEYTATAGNPCCRGAEPLYAGHHERLLVCAVWPDRGHCHR